MPVGLATLFLGAWQSFRENDLKALLAYSTVSTLGLLTLVYGLRAPEHDVLQLLSHATYKGALFMVAGIVEHATGTRDLRELGGLRKALPISFALCLLGVLSMGGLPPLFGFVAKEALYGSLLTGGRCSLRPSGLRDRRGRGRECVPARERAEAADRRVPGRRARRARRARVARASPRCCGYRRRCSRQVRSGSDC